MCKQKFACSKDAATAAERISRKLPLHQLADIEIHEVRQHTGRGRPRKDRNANVYYQVRGCVVPKQTAIDIEIGRAGRFILATNVVDASQLSALGCAALSIRHNNQPFAKHARSAYVVSDF